MTDESFISIDRFQQASVLEGQVVFLLYECFTHPAIHMYGLHVCYCLYSADFVHSTLKRAGCYEDIAYTIQATYLRACVRSMSSRI